MNGTEDYDNDLDELEVLFITETFHKNIPIREKPLQFDITRVWIKEKTKKKVVNGMTIKLEPQPKKSLNDRFTELKEMRDNVGIVFETELEDEDDGDDQYVDIDTTIEENLLAGSKGMKRSAKRNIAINLAKKLKKKAIANRLGVLYDPVKNTRLKDMRSRLGTTKSWSEKFGALLAAKKLLYLPLLFRKYKMGPQKTREELDIEIDLYMAEVIKAKKLKMGFDQIKAATNGSEDNNTNGLKVVDTKGFSFGGPGWRKRPKKEPKVEVIPDKEELDMEIDTYMANKDKVKVEVVSLTNGCEPDKEVLDMELDTYMSNRSRVPIKAS